MASDHGSRIRRSTAALGAGGPMVSRVGLGLAALGRPAYITSGREQDLPDRSVAGLLTRAFSMLDAAYAAGVRYVDAARSYGLAEEFLAGWRAGSISRLRACQEILADIYLWTSNEREVI